MWVRFLLFFLFFAFVEYKFIKEHYELQIYDLTRALVSSEEALDKRNAVVKDLIDISTQQQDIIFDYEIIIKKYYRELYNKDILNKRALYEPK